MNKILIFGLGKQGFKYVEYFFSVGYIVHGVNLSGKTDLEQISEIYSFNEITNIPQFFFADYSHIVLCISPVSQQEKVLNFIIDNEIYKEKKVIIEKPICENKILLGKIVDLDEIYFFIDELIVYNFLKTQGYFQVNELREVIVFFHSNEDIDTHPSVLEHIFGSFLEYEGIPEYIKRNFVVKLLPKKHKDAGMKYTLVIGGKIISYFQGCFYVNGGKEYCFNFKKSLEYILSSDRNSQKRVKYNYLKLKEIIKDMVCSK